MKRYILSAAALLLLAGCASSSPQTFGPAYGSEFGYRNTQLEQDRFRISYTSRNQLESRDFALLRAAQIADLEGYSHFQIINGGSFNNGPNVVSAGVGAGFGNFGRGRGGFNRTNVNLGVHDVARAFDGPIATEEIEVLLLSAAPAQKTPNVYSAQSVIRYIVPYGPASSLPQATPPAPAAPAPTTTP